MRENPGPIHPENPFATPPELRTPARRLRGRLAGPVTIWTAGPPEEPAGLTVSSVLVAEGEPARVLGLIGDLTGLWEAISSSGRFVVHALERSQRALADRFAGVLPSPGGMLRGLEVEHSAWGPALVSAPTRARCSLEASWEVGQHLLVTGVVDALDLHDLDEPLVWFRGRYWPKRL